MESVYEYLDYREYLKDYYNFNKKENYYFSYRYFGNKIGVDASFLVKVIQKNMHISNKTIPELTKFLKFNVQESEYFELLVFYSKAKVHSDIKLYFEKLMSFRSPFVQTLISDQYEFFNDWYNIALYELLTFQSFKGDYKELAQKLIPPRSPGEVKKAINLLLKLKLIQEQSDGSLKVVNKLISTGEDWESIAVRNFQKKMIKLSSEAIDRFSKGYRDVSTLTLSLSKKQLETMKERIYSMRKELLELAEIESDAQEVYQVNFQIFPLTAIEGGKK